MKKTVLLLLFSLFAFLLNAQPYINDINKFKQEDSVSFPEKKQILFIGSSSFTMWKEVQDAFPDKKILNRAFGGSTLADLNRYVADIVYPYQPKQIVIYCGENDFSGGSTLTPPQVLERFKTLFTLIRKKYKKVPIVYVSMKPSPSREHLIDKFKEANKLIKSFLKKKKRTAYVDVFSAMLNADGTIMEDIFLSDKLHMNKKGYDIWVPIIREKLK